MNKISIRYCAAGLAFLVMVVAVVVVVFKLFRGDFVSTEPLSVDAPRAGLLMDPGAEVKLRGVEVGKVKAVHSSVGGARLTLAITPQYMHLIPSNVQAEIVPPTAFGAKYVSLELPASSAAPIAKGATIDAQHVTVEANVAFENLMNLLTAAQPQAVNAALNALSGALQGNGAKTGRLISSADKYLSDLNPALPQLTKDADDAASVLQLYNRLAPGLLDVAGNVTTTATTLTDEEANLHKLLSTFSSTADDLRTLLSSNGKQLVDTLNLLDPLTGLLSTYSPEFSCTLKGAQVLHSLALPVLGGDEPGVSTTTRFHLSQDPYTYSDNLPIDGADNAPNCYGLPNLGSANAKQSHAVYNTGANPYLHPTNTEQVDPNALLQLLLGIN